MIKRLGIDPSLIKEIGNSSSSLSTAEFDQLRGVFESHTGEMKEMNMLLQKLNLDRAYDKEKLKNLILDMRVNFSGRSPPNRLVKLLTMVVRFPSFLLLNFLMISHQILRALSGKIKENQVNLWSIFA